MKQSFTYFGLFKPIWSNFDPSEITTFPKILKFYILNFLVGNRQSNKKNIFYRKVIQIPVISILLDFYWHKNSQTYIEFSFGPTNNYFRLKSEFFIIFEKKWDFLKFDGFTSQLCFAVQQSIFIEFQRSYHQNFRFFSNFLNLSKTLIFCHFWFKFGQISTKNVFFEVGNFIWPNFSQKGRKSKKSKKFRKFKQNLKIWGYKR